MTWTKLSDDFGEDCWILSDAAFRLHVEGLLWSNSKLLDCRIPMDDLRRFAKHPDIVPELLERGIWVDDGDAYVIVHHAPHQPSREQVIAFRQSQSAKGKKGGRPRKPTLVKPTENPPAKPVEKPSGRDGTGRVTDGPAAATTWYDDATWLGAETTS
jgi:hypothetical protein